MIEQIPTKPKRDISAIMRNVRSTDTAPELLLKEALVNNKIAYDEKPPKLIGKPDIVLSKNRVVIFVDGDFWHGGQWQKRKLAQLESQFSMTSNKAYWLSKIRRTINRDCVNTNKLLNEGWKVIRFWESQIYADLNQCISVVIEAVYHNNGSNIFTRLSQRTFAEFFAGIGLMRMGLEEQGWLIKFANDIDEQKEEMYKRHFQDKINHFILSDIHKLSLNNVPSVTLFTASFPCNDLSLAGSRNGLDGKHSSAFWGLIKLIEEMGNSRPPVVLLENVTGFLSSNKGNDFALALSTLNSLGYKVDAFILDASSFVPQSRQRLFVLAFHQDLGGFGNIVSKDSLVETNMRPKELIKFIRSHNEIQWNNRLLPMPPQGSKKLEDILEDLTPDAPEWWSKERVEYLLNQMSTRHREKAENMISGDHWSYATVFRRMRNGKSMAELRTDGIAGCLRTPRGGSGRQILFKAGYGASFARLVSPREAARLMGADDYILPDSTNQALFGFGDAVCVSVIEWIVQNYLNPAISELLRGRVLFPEQLRLAL